MVTTIGFFNKAFVLSCMVNSSSLSSPAVCESGEAALGGSLTVRMTAIETAKPTMATMKQVCRHPSSSAITMERELSPPPT